MNTQTHTQTKYCNPRCACTPRVDNKYAIQGLIIVFTTMYTDGEGEGESSTPADAVRRRRWRKRKRGRRAKRGRHEEEEEEEEEDIFDIGSTSVQSMDGDISREELLKRLLQVSFTNMQKKKKNLQNVV